VRGMNKKKITHTGWHVTDRGNTPAGS
jgi:hypothetical protein